MKYVFCPHLAVQFHLTLLQYDPMQRSLQAIGNYLDELAQKGILKDVSVEIDVAANKQYLIKKGVDVSTMTDVELKEAATGNKVFLRATMKILDAIEEIVLPIVI